MPAETEHIGTLLLEEGLLTRRDLERAAAVQAESGLPLTRVLVEEHIVAEGDIVRLLARHSGLEYVNLAETTIDGPGFLNFRFSRRFWSQCLAEIEREDYARLDLGKGERVLKIA